MDVGHPHRIFGETVDSDVLAVLARTTRPLSGRAIARLSGRSQKRVRDVLQRLVASGLVHEQEAAPAILFTLNWEHLAAPAVLLAAGLRAALIERIREAVAAWRLQPLHLSIFGSAARGDGDAGSDIDVFVVRPAGTAADDAEWRAQLDKLAKDVLLWSGNHAGVSEVDEVELARLRRERPPVVDSIRQDAVTLAGPSAEQLLRAAS